MRIYLRDKEICMECKHYNDPPFKDIVACGLEKPIKFYSQRIRVWPDMADPPFNEVLPPSNCPQKMAHARYRLVDKLDRI